MKILSGDTTLCDFSHENCTKQVDTFIITRFNLRLWTKDKHNRPTQSRDWIEQRFKLFDKYCFPSIKNQSNHEFLWLCLFDEQSTSPFLEKIKNYMDELPSFLPLFLDDKDTENTADCISKCILQYKNDSDTLITIRLDNDDALGIDFVQSVKRYADTTEGTTIYSFKFGIQYFVHDEIAAHIPFYNNHFLSMVSRDFHRDDFCKRKVQHVLQFNHFDVENYPYPFVCNTEDKDMWMEVIHAKNVSNDCKMTLHQAPVQESVILANKFNIRGGDNLPYISKCKFWKFMALRFLKHMIMKISSKL